MLWVIKNAFLHREVAKLQIRTISAILAWVVVALLIANFSFKSELLLWIALGIVVIALVIYFIPRFRKSATPAEDKKTVPGENQLLKIS